MIHKETSKQVYRFVNRLEIIQGNKKIDGSISRQFLDNAIPSPALAQTSGEGS